MRKNFAQGDQTATSSRFLDDVRFAELPKPLRDLINYDQPSRLSAAQLHQAMMNGKGVIEIMQICKAHAERSALALYGPGYPADLAGKPLKR